MSKNITMKRLKKAGWVTHGRDDEHLRFSRNYNVWFIVAQKRDELIEFYLFITNYVGKENWVRLDFVTMKEVKRFCSAISAASQD